MASIGKVQTPARWHWRPIIDRTASSPGVNACRGMPAAVARVRNRQALQAVEVELTAEVALLAERRPESVDRGVAALVPRPLQFLEGDYIDHRKNGDIQGHGHAHLGVELDDDGKRVAYWLFRMHPGEMIYTEPMSYISDRVPAREVIHLYEPLRLGQMRGVPWFSPGIVDARNIKTYQESERVRKRIEACIAAVVIGAAAASPCRGSFRVRRLGQGVERLRRRRTRQVHRDAASGQSPAGVWQKYRRQERKKVTAESAEFRLKSISVSSQADLTQLRASETLGSLNSGDAFSAPMLAAVT